ncbi:hypothetical protein CF094_10335 [Clostridium botulinum]|nr:hypothetical protein [Clostridium botulinum]
MASPRRPCVNYTIKFNLFWCVVDPRGIPSQDLKGMPRRLFILLNNRFGEVRLALMACFTYAKSPFV